MRAVLAVVLAGVVAAFVLDASGRAPRGAGSNHTSPAVFATTLRTGGTVCQPAAYLPADAARAQILIGTYGRPVPGLRLTFLDAANNQVASGQLNGGAREGAVTIPITQERHARGAVGVCLHVSGSSPVALGGEAGPVGPGSAQIGGRQQPGRVSLHYYRQGTESWWALLPQLTHRFGLGKASFFGDWTLPVVALLLLCVWVATVRLIARRPT